jgi:uncharacterized membrane protein
MSTEPSTPHAPAATSEDQIASWRAERLYRREHPVAWWVSMLAPFVLSGVILAFLSTTQGIGAAVQFVITCMAILLIFGKTVIAGGHMDVSESVEFYSPEELVAIALYTDFFSVAIVVFHMGLLFRLPFIGHRLERMVRAARTILDANGWMKRLTFAGLITFASLPVSGGISAAIMGRLLGMARLTTFVCAMIGSVFGCALIYYFSELMMKYFSKENPLYVIAGVLVFVAILLLIYRRYRRLRKAKQLDEQRQADDPLPTP